MWSEKNGSKRGSFLEANINQLIRITDKNLFQYHIIRIYVIEYQISLNIYYSVTTVFSDEFELHDIDYI